MGAPDQPPWVLMLIWAGILTAAVLLAIGLYAIAMALL